MTARLLAFGMLVTSIAASGAYAQSAPPAAAKPATNAIDSGSIQGLGTWAFICRC
jgi:hypothetical protein